MLSTQKRTSSDHHLANKANRLQSTTNVDPRPSRMNKFTSDMQSFRSDNRKHESSSVYIIVIFARVGEIWGADFQTERMLSHILNLN